MVYERLTKRLPDGDWDYADSVDTDKYLSAIAHAHERLCDLEDMIESGQAVILQAKIGDWVYGCSKALSRIVYGKIYRIDISGYYGTTYHVYENDGNNLYLLDFVSKNKEAAEAKLNELRRK